MIAVEDLETYSVPIGSIEKAWGELAGEPVRVDIGGGCYRAYGSNNAVKQLADGFLTAQILFTGITGWYMRLDAGKEARQIELLHNIKQFAPDGFEWTPAQTAMVKAIAQLWESNPSQARIIEKGVVELWCKSCRA